MGLGAPPFTHELGLSGYQHGGADVGQPQHMFLDGGLQLPNRPGPFGVILIESAGAQFSNSVLKATSGHTTIIIRERLIKMSYSGPWLDTLHTVGTLEGSKDAALPRDSDAMSAPACLQSLQTAPNLVL